MTEEQRNLAHKWANESFLLNLALLGVLLAANAVWPSMPLAAAALGWSIGSAMSWRAARWRKP